MPRFSGPKKDDNLPQTLMDRAQNMWSNIKYLFRFYLNGVKQIWKNRTTVREIHADVRRTKRDYTWEEMQMIRTHSKDMVKLPFFVLILATVEELLPLMVIYTPFMLPSTCILPSQLTKIRQRFELKRSTAIKSLRATLPTLDVSNVSDKSAQAAVATLPSQALHELATVYNLSKWGGSIMQRGRIVSHMRILKEDDERLIKSKTFTSTEDADYKLSNACIQRGICAVNVSSKDMRLSLQRWLDVTLRPNPPSPLERILLPMRIPQFGAPETELRPELDEQDSLSVKEKTSTVVEEVVEQEKRRETKKSS